MQTPSIQGGNRAKCGETNKFTPLADPVKGGKSVYSSHYRPIAMLYLLRDLFRRHAGRRGVDKHIQLLSDEQPLSLRIDFVDYL